MSKKKGRGNEKHFHFILNNLFYRNENRNNAKNSSKFKELRMNMLGVKYGVMGIKVNYQHMKNDIKKV
ncbi:CLUMA_CG004318, isoform A [Clunio marinus]|uniref:CLUMA_CG004318, isoform A n=1 Tax=Clunio marinus TaxID=568069 RepID=A0A1J1HRB4_9DIPT|nr:CLUMA_CG004318, isoform A [Clunio marinus]